MYNATGCVLCRVMSEASRVKSYRPVMFPVAANTSSSSLALASAISPSMLVMEVKAGPVLSYAWTRSMCACMNSTQVMSSLANASREIEIVASVTSKPDTLPTPVKNRTQNTKESIRTPILHTLGFKEVSKRRARFRNENNGTSDCPEIA